MKKLASFFISAVLIFSFTGSAFAATNTSVHHSAKSVHSAPAVHKNAKTKKVSVSKNTKAKVKMNRKAKKTS